MMHAEFQALAQGKCDYTLKVVPIANEGETLMTILATEEAVYISKAQAMAFFGLVDAAPAEQGERKPSDDAARLDWLEQFHRLRASEGMSKFYGDLGTCLVERTSDGWMLDRELDRDMPEFDTLREAIDAAMANDA